MNLIKRHVVLRRLRRDYPDLSKRDIKQNLKECKYNALRCRLALNDAIMADCEHALGGGNGGAAYPPSDAFAFRNNDRYEEPSDERSHNQPIDPVYANEVGFNAPRHQVPRCDYPARRNPILRRQNTPESGRRVCGSRDDQDDSFDEDSSEVQRSPKPRDESALARTASMDPPRRILIQSEVPIRKVTVFERQNTPESRWRVCGSRDDQGNEDTPSLLEIPEIRRATNLNDYLCAPSNKPPAQAKSRDLNLSRDASAQCPDSRSNPPILDSGNGRCFCIFVEPASSSLNSLGSSVDLGAASSSVPHLEQLYNKTRRSRCHSTSSILW